MRVWHGTTKEVMPRIREHGIQPKAAPGADNWAYRVRRVEYNDTQERDESVYFSTNRDIAEGFAFLSAEERNETPTVLEIVIPSEAETKIARDEHGAPRIIGVGAFLRMKGTIPPSWIVREYEVSERNRNQMRPDISTMDLFNLLLNSYK